MKPPELATWLRERYRQWEAFLADIGPDRMLRPGANNGPWSMKDLVAHLTGWNRWLIARMRSAQRGETDPTPPWPARLKEEDDINAWIYTTNRDRSLPDVLDEARQVFDQLLALVQDLPEGTRIERVEPDYHLVLLGEQRFLTSEFFDHFHDDHEADVRAWLARER